MFQNIINAVKRCYTLLVSFAVNTVSFLFNLPMYLLDLAKKATTAAFESLMQVRILFGTTLLVLAGSASAAVDEAVTTALTTATTDVSSVGNAVFIVLVAAAAIRYLRRVL